MAAGALEGCEPVAGNPSGFCTSSRTGSGTFTCGTGCGTGSCGTGTAMLGTVTCADAGAADISITAVHTTARTAHLDCEARAYTLGLQSASERKA